MAHSLADPTTVEVHSVISIHETINALCLFAEKYPGERVSPIQVARIRAAADAFEQSIAEFRATQTK